MSDLLEEAGLEEGSKRFRLPSNRGGGLSRQKEVQEQRRSRGDG